MTHYFNVLKKYVVFSGRATRKEYWMFQLFHILIFGVLLIFGGASIDEGGELVPGVLGNIYLITTFLPALAVQVRRFHDVGQSAWLLLVFLVPLVGSLIASIFSLLASKCPKCKSKINHYLTECAVCKTDLSTLYK
jgi:uncharacterized membrane protein YhaH (DUF805 family)